MSQAISSAPTTSPATAPQADGAASQASAPESGRVLNSAEDIVSRLDQNDHLDELTASAQSGESQDQEVNGHDGKNIDDSAGAAESKPEEAVAPPASWNKADQEFFAALPADVKKTIARRETERDTFVKTKGEEANQARLAHDRLLQHAQATLHQALSQANAAIEGEFAGIDWTRLQQSDPMLFTQLDGMRKQRLEGVQAALQRQKELSAYAQQQQMGQLAKHYQVELKGVADRLGAINGTDASVLKWKEKAEAYLEKNGCPKGHLSNISHAYQVELIAKSMKYDEFMANAASAEKKVAEAPKVQNAKGRPDFSGTGVDTSAARDRIRKGGSGTENVADALKSLGF